MCVKEEEDEAVWEGPRKLLQVSKSLVAGVPNPLVPLGIQKNYLSLLDSTSIPSPPPCKAGMHFEKKIN